MRIDNKFKLCLIIFLFSNSLILAQNSIKNGEYHLKANSFKVSREGEKFKNIVIAEKNKFFSRDLNTVPRFDLPGDRLNSKENIQTSLIKVLGNSRIQEIPKGHRLLVNVYIDTKGKILSVTFVNIGEETSLSLDEFDQLASYIKENVHFDVTDFVGSNSEYAFLTYFVSFDKLAAQLHKTS